MAPVIKKTPRNFRIFLATLLVGGWILLGFNQLATAQEEDACSHSVALLRRLGTFERLLDAAKFHGGSPPNSLKLLTDLVSSLQTQVRAVQLKQREESAEPEYRDDYHDEGALGYEDDHGQENPYLRQSDPYGLQAGLPYFDEPGQKDFLSDATPQKLDDNILPGPSTAETRDPKFDRVTTPNPLPKTVTKEPVEVPIEWMIRKDLPEVLAAEKRIWPEGAWSEVAFLTELRKPNCVGMTAKVNGQVAGYMVYGLHPDFLKVLNFAVVPEFQRQGVGDTMIKKLIAKTEHPSRKQVRVDVGIDDLVARQLLAKHRFFESEKKDGRVTMTYQRPEVREPAPAR